MDDQKYIYDPEKLVTKDEKLRDFNPLLIPVILGWERLTMGTRSIYYVSPCGRRLNTLEEVHPYLRVTHSTLEIDFFNFERDVHVFNYFSPERKFYKIDDISYGKENVPVSCINSLDNEYPEYVEYTTVRLPQQNVDIPLDEESIICCDCDDGCQDKEKCECLQLTIQSTAASNPDGNTNDNAGYEFRRLKERVSTGIYECNKFCKCSKTCLNRVAQNPLRIPLQVFKTDRRGWGTRTLVDVPTGCFICIYVGNLYTDEEAEKQGKNYGDEYLAELNCMNHYEGDVYVMDGKSNGNIARYINHSCDPNVYVQYCFVDTHDLRFPWIALFASRFIPAGEELSWDYNYRVIKESSVSILHSFLNNSKRSFGEVIRVIKVSHQSHQSLGI